MLNPMEQYQRWLDKQPDEALDASLAAAFQEGWRRACQTVLSEIRSNTPIWSPEGHGEAVMSPHSVSKTVTRVQQMLANTGDKS